MDIRKVANQLYKYTYPKVELQAILDLISENYAAWEGNAWKQTLNYYKQIHGHSWVKYVYKKLDYPDLYKLDIITSFRQYYASLKDKENKVTPQSLSGSNS